MFPSLFSCFCTQEPNIFPTIDDDDREGRSERESSIAQSYIDLAQEFYEKGLIMDAIDCLEYSIKLNSGSSRTHLQLGYFYQAMGEFICT